MKMQIPMGCDLVVGNDRRRMQSLSSTLARDRVERKDESKMVGVE